MDTTALTIHAGQRLQQRAIPPYVLDLLEEFGSPFRCYGAERLVFDKAAKMRLKRHFGGKRFLRLMEPWLEVYAVLGDRGSYVTAAHATRRMKRDTCRWKIQ